MVHLKVKACGFMKLACIFVGCFFCLFVFQIFFRRAFLTFAVRSPTIIGIVRPQYQNDNHHPADNNVDGQELAMDDKGEPVNGNNDRKCAPEGWDINKRKQGL